MSLDLLESVVLLETVEKLGLMVKKAVRVIQAPLVILAIQVRKKRLHTLITIRAMTYGYCIVLGTSRTAYTVWGSDTCPDSTEHARAYRGKAVAGMGRNPLCIATKDHAESGSIPAIESEGSPPKLNVVSFRYNGNLIPLKCAACHVTNKSVSIIVFATTTCPANWDREYRGTLMTTPTPGMNYICVELPDSAVNVNSVLEAKLRKGVILGPVMKDTECVIPGGCSKPTIIECAVCSL